MNNKNIQNINEFTIPPWVLTSLANISVPLGRAALSYFSSSFLETFKTYLRNKGDAIDNNTREAFINVATGILQSDEEVGRDVKRMQNNRNRSTLFNRSRNRSNDDFMGGTF